jgi:hypothetical protein
MCDAGPYVLADLNEQIATKLLNERSLVWRKGMLDWQVASMHA